MPPKKAATRSGSSSIGPSCPQPDVGSLYILRNVLPACVLEETTYPDLKEWAIACKISQKVIAKWKCIHPTISLLDEDSVAKNIIRKYNQAKSPSKKREKLLIHLFSLV